MLQHKGQAMVLEGNMIGEQIVSPKLSYDAMMNLEYEGTCKVGIDDVEPRHFIRKLIWDVAGNFVKEVFATNNRYTGATDITVDLSTAEALITCTNGDFNEVLPGDSLYINTVINPDIWITIKQKVTDDSVLIGIVDSALLTAEVATPVAATDIILVLNDKKTKDFDKRRWDLRTLYIYS